MLFLFTKRHVLPLSRNDFFLLEHEIIIACSKSTNLKPQPLKFMRSLISNNNHPIQPSKSSQQRFFKGCIGHGTYHNCSLMVVSIVNSKKCNSGGG
jgi:hypothetical protein